MKPLPTTPEGILALTWKDIEPHYRELVEQPLGQDNLTSWLSAWSRAAEIVDELYNRLYVATTCNTADKQVEAQFQRFLDEIYPYAMQAEQDLKQKLLSSELEPVGFEIPLRNMRAEAMLFRESNIPLLAEEQKLNTEYDQIIGAQTVEWRGSENTLTQLRAELKNPDRATRQKVWQLIADRQLADRAAINALWQKNLKLRLRIAAQADQPDYRAYRWKSMLRFDYTPDDCLRFHNAIEEVVVPVARRIYDRRRQRLGLESLRPWDLDVDPDNRPAMKPFQRTDELIRGISAIYHHVSPILGENFDQMVQGGLLDPENRKNKAPGAYCTALAVARRPFIFMNAIGLHDDVQTLLHEGGHAMHVFESSSLPYIQQTNVSTEFAEVASMSMEFLGMPYLTHALGGFYNPQEAARAQIEHIEKSILFWPYMAVVDAFQHWVYTHPELALDPANCDAEWGRLWLRFMDGVDWQGSEDIMRTGWHLKLHIHTIPFYYIEYGLAQLGAVQIWRNSLTDETDAVAAYRKALSLGGTIPLPKLFETAGAKLAFDADTLRDAIILMETQIEELEHAANQ